MLSNTRLIVATKLIWSRKNYTKW